MLTLWKNDSEDRVGSSLERKETKGRVQVKSDGATCKQRGRDEKICREYLSDGTTENENKRMWRVKNGKDLDKWVIIK